MFMHLRVGYNSRDLDLSRALHQILNGAIHQGSPI